MNCEFLMESPTNLIMKFFIVIIVLLNLYFQVALASISDPSVIWNKNYINVCWQDNIPLNESLFTESQWRRLNSANNFLFKETATNKNFIKDIIEIEFNISKTGVQFIGWEICNDYIETDVVIITVRSQEHPLGRASVGRSHTNDEVGRREILPKDKKAFVFLNLIDVPNSNMKYLDEVAYTAVHEFGHLAGLTHENTHPEASNDPNCTEEDLFPDFSQETVNYLTDYDPSSIMNYCLYNFLSKTGLFFYANNLRNIWNEQNNSILPFANFAIYSDPLIFKRNDVGQDTISVQAEIRLSSRDIQGLRSLYIGH